MHVFNPRTLHKKAGGAAADSAETSLAHFSSCRCYFLGSLRHRGSATIPEIRFSCPGFGYASIAGRRGYPAGAPKTTATRSPVPPTVHSFHFRFRRIATILPSCNPVLECGDGHVVAIPVPSNGRRLRGSHGRNTSVSKVDLDACPCCGRDDSAHRRLLGFII